MKLVLQIAAGILVALAAVLLLDSGWKAYRQAQVRADLNRRLNPPFVPIESTTPVLEFTQIGRLNLDDSTVCLTIEVSNVSTFMVNKAKLHGVAIDSAGTRIGTWSGLFAKSDGEPLRPRSSAPLNLCFSAMHPAQVKELQLYVDSVAIPE